jgi:hypothetical protein
VRYKQRKISFVEMHVHVPQAGDEKEPFAGNGAGAFGNAGFGAGVDDRVDAIANDHYCLATLRS